MMFAKYICILFSISLTLFSKPALGHDENDNSGMFESLVRLEKLHNDMEKETELLQTYALSANGQKGGSSSGNYIRWGKTACPQHAIAIYKGVAGGSFYTQTGAASNYLCLPDEPEWNNNTKDDNTQNSAGAQVYGAEYQLDGINGFFGDTISDFTDNVPCAVCETKRTNILMIPGKTTCVAGWTLEYTGFLSAGHHGHASASEFVCLDEDPENIVGGEANENGKLFFLAEARCGSLPCPPYVDGRIMACVVCSK